MLRQGTGHRVLIRLMKKTERCELWNKQKKRILKMISKAKFIWSVL